MALTPSDITIPFHVYVPAEMQVYLHDLVMWRPPQHAWDVLGLAGVVAIIYLVGWLLNRPRRTRLGEDDMARHFRNARVRYIVGEGITEFVEEAVFKDKLTRDESIDIYTKIGQAFSLVDLLPKRKPKKKLSRGEAEYLKEQIKDRIKRQTTENVVTLERPRGSKLKRA